MAAGRVVLTDRADALLARPDLGEVFLGRSGQEGSWIRMSLPSARRGMFSSRCAGRRQANIAGRYMQPYRGAAGRG
jgi:hypothetical protein